MRSGMCEVFDIEVGTFEFLKESHFKDSKTQGISVPLLISHISIHIRLSSHLPSCSKISLKGP